MKRFLILSLLLIAGCGKPRVGDKCSSGYVLSNEPFCDGSDLWVCTAAKLRPGNEGTWVKTPCKGAGGCTAPEDAKPTCDISGNAEGDPCAYQFTYNNSLSTCSAADPKVRLECSGGKLVKTVCPGSCWKSEVHVAVCVE